MKFKHRFAIGLLLWAALCAAGIFSVRADVPPCIPGISGTPAPFAPRAEYGLTGRHIYWWCKAADGVTYTHGFSCLHNGGCDYTRFGLTLNGLNGTSTQRANAASTAWAASIGFDCNDVMTEQTPRGDLCRERDTTLLANQSVWLEGLVQPGTPVWKVKPSGTATTRPAYTLTNGVLGTKEAGRATVGTMCDLTKSTAPATGGDIRAEFGTAGLVTICAKEK